MKIKWQSKIANSKLCCKKRTSTLHAGASWIKNLKMKQNCKIEINLKIKKQLKIKTKFRKKYSRRNLNTRENILLVLQYLYIIHLRLLNSLKTLSHIEKQRFSYNITVKTIYSYNTFLHRREKIGWRDLGRANRISTHKSTIIKNLKKENTPTRKQKTEQKNKIKMTIRNSSQRCMKRTSTQWTKPYSKNPTRKNNLNAEKIIQMQK